MSEIIDTFKARNYFKIIFILYIIFLSTEKLIKISLSNDKNIIIINEELKDDHEINEKNKVIY